MSRALFTGLSGLMAHQARLDVIGNNIANVNTTAFKAGDALFKTTFSQLLSIGSAPNNTIYGINPSQIGLGVKVGAIRNNFNQGVINPTGVSTDLAISGNGLFVLEGSGGNRFYTRDGAFDLNAEQVLVNQDGLKVLGFMADDNFVITPSGPLGEITIPLGSLSLAQQTSYVNLAGNLNSDGTVATQGSLLTSGTHLDASTTLAATASTLLTDLQDSTATNLFALGDTITLNADLGGRELSPQTFTVTSTSQVSDLTDFFENALGIDTTSGQINTPGITIDGTGAFTVTGNIGTLNDIDNLSITSDGTVVNPFTFTKSQSADGESAFVPMTVYDSLGNPVNVGMTVVFESTSSTGNTWRWYAQSSDTLNGDTTVGTGQIQFDTDGQLTSDDASQIVIDRSGIGAATPLSIDPVFENITQLASAASEIGVSHQDGAEQGVLADFQIGGDGVITGLFTNGLTRHLAQIAVATFTNNEGLVAKGDNLFTTGPNSGNAVITTPGSLGAGTLVSNALEGSNVDLAKEFVNLITTSTGFSANTRVITTSNDLLSQLIGIIR